MQKSVLVALAVVCVSVVSPPQVFSSSDVCLELGSILLGEEFTAKVPLYDTKVEVDGISKLERDKEEVPQGSKLVVLKVECEGKTLEVKIREISTKKTEAAKIYFRFSQRADDLPDPVGDLRKMMGHVFELTDQDSGTQEQR